MKRVRRRGIASAGSWVMDHVKFIRRYPAAGNLVTIESIEKSPGGCPHNVLVDLARMKTGLPLYAGGYIGNDEDGTEIHERVSAEGIDAVHLEYLPEISTSYTDVFSEREGGRTRTFFHCRGANAMLTPEKILSMNTPARIFHLGYLLLLDELDKPDDRYGIAAARVLHELRERGYLTSIDVVSEESDRLQQILRPCLPHVDYLIVNEVEAGAYCRFVLRDADGKIDLPAVARAARMLLEAGVRKRCVIHFPEGGYATETEGEAVFVPSRTCPPEKIVSTVGAGDAFCAGMLYACHEGFSLKESLILAGTSAWFNLLNATSTGGAPTLAEIETCCGMTFRKILG